MKTEASTISGILVIHKPKGMGSKDVSRAIAKKFGKLKMGHVGTLDPEASGVLPLLFGQATKVQDYLLVHPKAYTFTIEFGYETDTLDSEGRITKENDLASPSLEQIENICSQFVGWIDQIPPLYSAVKFKGQSLHKYARQEKTEDLDMAQFKRKVEIKSLKLLKVDGKKARFTVRCGKGTYVRCLGRDLAYALGTLATTTEIIRTESSGFHLEEAFSLDQVMAAEELTPFLRPLSQINLGLPKLCIQPGPNLEKLRNGQKITFSKSFMDASLEGQLNSLELSEDSCFSEAIAIYENRECLFGIAEARRLQNELTTVFLKRGLWI